MANEAVIIELLGLNRGCPVRYTCADGATIPKGTILKITDGRTVVAHSGADQPIAGIAAAEKLINDGSTTIAVYTNGIFDLTAAAGGATNLAVCAGSATANKFTAADANDMKQNSFIGYLLENAANDEVAAVRILK
jgi:hypothetical protein